LVRLADADSDADAVAAIYRPVVEGTVISFEEIAPTATEMARRMRGVMERCPWLVAESDGAVVAYAYAGPHRERAAYRWSVDVSAYVAEGHRGRGMGRRLYRELLTLLRSQGMVNVFAGVTLPNPASIALHESIGMRRIGVYERIGFKFGGWHDVAWYGLRLADPPGAPPEPLSMQELSRVDGVSGGVTLGAHR
jgi:phosphinothricin acetyltransferase